jgi:DNA-binding MarR family transcriptional regulator
MAKRIHTPKKRGFDSPQQEVYLSMWRTYDRLRAIEEALFDQWNLTAQQYNVLRLLEAKHPEPMPTLQLSARLISRAPDITRMLDKLEEQGWLQRARSTEDRRAVMVALTTKGRSQLKEMASKVKAMHVAQIGHLTVEQMRDLLALLEAARAPHEPEGSDWKTESD